MPSITPVDLPATPFSVVPSGTDSASGAAANMAYFGARDRVMARPTPTASSGEEPAAGIPSGAPGVAGQPSPGSSSTAPSSSGSPRPGLPQGPSPTGPVPGSPAAPQPPIGPIGPIKGVAPGGGEPPSIGPTIGIGSQRPAEDESGLGAESVGLVGVFGPDPEVSGQILPGNGSGDAGGETEVGPRTLADTEIVSRSGVPTPGSSTARSGQPVEAGPVGAGRRGRADGDEDEDEDEDEEYPIKYLEEEDGNELFGASGVSVPAVIGESVFERARRRGAPDSTARR